jgi:hypothetical protein
MLELKLSLAKIQLHPDTANEPFQVIHTRNVIIFTDIHAAPFMGIEVFLAAQS